MNAYWNHLPDITYISCDDPIVTSTGETKVQNFFFWSRKATMTHRWTTQHNACRSGNRPQDPTRQHITQLDELWDDHKTYKTTTRLTHAGLRLRAKIQPQSSATTPTDTRDTYLKCEQENGHQETTMQGVQVNNISRTIMALCCVSLDSLRFDNTLINLKFMSTHQISAMYHIQWWPTWGAIHWDSRHVV